MVLRATKGGCRLPSWHAVGRDAASFLLHFYASSHTWFGGSAEESYTDVNGPAASAEIVRFFLRPHARNAAASAAV